MARRTGQRDIFNPSLGELDSLLTDPLSPLPTIVSPAVPSSLYREVEDRRTYWPGYRSPALFSGQPAPVGESAKPKAWRAPTRFGFTVPKETMICVRRKQRREVIFAKRKRRKGAGARRRRNYWSNIHC